MTRPPSCVSEEEDGAGAGVGDPGLGKLGEVGDGNRAGDTRAPVRRPQTDGAAAVREDVAGASADQALAARRAVAAVAHVRLQFGAAPLGAGEHGARAARQPLAGQRGGRGVGEQQLDLAEYGL